MEYLIGALIAWVVLSFLEQYTLISGVLEFPMDVIHVIMEIVFYPFVLFYRIFLRHTINPVESERIQKSKILEDSKHLFGSIWICFDKKAKRLGNKVFLFRIISDEKCKLGVDN